MLQYLIYTIHTVDAMLLNQTFMTIITVIRNLLKSCSLCMDKKVISEIYTLNSEVTKHYYNDDTRLLSSL